MENKDLLSSRETILSAIKANQPESTVLPGITIFDTEDKGSLKEFAGVLSSVGGKAFYVSGNEEITELILAEHGPAAKIVSPLPEFKALCDERIEAISSAHNLYDVDVAILKARFGVAENGAVWLTEDQMYHRVLPFICQHLAVIIEAKAIVPTMHQAYGLIDGTTYGFGTFIAGPSKTADIEQSLVIGAHGPRSMTVFIMQ